MCSVFRQHKKLNHRNGDLNNKVMHTIFQDLPKLSGNIYRSHQSHWNPIGIPLVQLRRSKAPVAPSKVHSMPCRVATKKCLGCHFMGRDNIVYMQEITGKSLAKHDVYMLYSIV